MRLSTIASVALLAASTAALAQVAGTPVEQKISPGNDAGGAASGNTLADNVMVDPTIATTGQTRDDTLENATLPDAPANAAAPR